MADLLLRGAGRILGAPGGSPGGNLLVRNGLIAAIGPDVGLDRPEAGTEVDLRGATVEAGRRRVTRLAGTLWPASADPFAAECAHDEESLRVSAEAGLVRLLRGGVTEIVDLGTARDYDTVLDACARVRIRVAGGKALRDRPGAVPVDLLETTLDALTSAFDQSDRWDGAGDGRIRYVLLPASAVTATDVLFRETAALAGGKMPRVTSLAATAAERRLEHRLCGDVVSFLAGTGFLGPRATVIGPASRRAESAAVAAAGAEWREFAPGGDSPGGDSPGSVSAGRTLGPGSPADLVVREPGLPDLGRASRDRETEPGAPCEDARTSVRTVLIGGEVVFDGGRPLGLEPERVERAVRRHGERLRERLGGAPLPEGTPS